jgi:hypothetical protein
VWGHTRSLGHFRHPKKTNNAKLAKTLLFLLCALAKVVSARLAHKNCFMLGQLLFSLSLSRVAWSCALGLDLGLGLGVLVVSVDVGLGTGLDLSLRFGLLRLGLYL